MQMTNLKKLRKQSHQLKEKLQIWNLQFTFLNQN